jgi:hypothetical protein
LLANAYIASLDASKSDQLAKGFVFINLLNHFVRDDDVNLDLGNEIHLIRRTT